MTLTRSETVWGIPDSAPDGTTGSEYYAPRSEYYRQYQRDYRAGIRRRGLPRLYERTRPQPVCSECGYRIEGCIGKFGDWKHVFNNREIADDGHRAMPECEP